jgi:hypothetical protein
MMLLKDVRDYLAAFGIAEDEHCYMGIMPDKKEKSIGVYHLRSGRQAVTPIGGQGNRSYGVKAVSVLVHWNRSPTETEEAAVKVYQRLQNTQEQEINGHRIKFIQIKDEPVSVGTDESGIFEYVMECLIYYESEEEEEECQI